MAKVMGNRPHRVNLDGKSCTEVGVSTVALMPGSFVYFDAAEWKNVGATKRPLPFVVQCADHIGGSIIEPIEAGESVTGDRAEPGRVFALLVPAGTVVKANETLLKMHATLPGVLEVTTGPFDDVVAMAIEDYTVPASPATAHIKARIV